MCACECCVACVHATLMLPSATNQSVVLPHATPMQPPAQPAVPIQRRRCSASWHQPSGDTAAAGSCRPRSTSGAAAVAAAAKQGAAAQLPQHEPRAPGGSAAPTGATGGLLELTPVQVCGQTFCHLFPAAAVPRRSREPGWECTPGQVGGCCCPCCYTCCCWCLLCGSYRGLASAFNSLFAELRDRADIRGVYITEAHAQVGCAAH